MSCVRPKRRRSPRSRPAKAIGWSPAPRSSGSRTPSSRRRRSTPAPRPCGCAPTGRAPEPTSPRRERAEKHQREVVEADARLLSSGAISRASVEADERALRQAEDRTRAARAQAEGLEGAGSRLALAERSAAELERRVAALTLKAPGPGVVYGLPRRVGETVAAGAVVASVVDPENRRLRARVDQPDLPRIAVGQRLILSFDGLPREKWEGTVTFVSPGLTRIEGREVGEVLGDVADPSHRLPTNAAVEVEIVAGEKSNTLVVPRASVLRDGEKRFLYLAEDGRARRREVQVGLSGLTEVEILGGVSEKDAVILPGSTALSEGLRVRPSA